MELYKDKSLSPEERARDLLSRMTLKEKLLQMNTFPWKLDQIYKDIQDGKDVPVCGAVFGNINDIDKLKAVQDYCIEKTGIPALFARDGIRSFINGTVFPHCAGLGGSFDTDAVGKMADIMGMEARAVGIRQLYGPDVDIPRDPRWGRVQESYGEDPYVNGEMGKAVVEGLQKNEVGATVKHFIAYGVPEGGINLAPAHIGEREIREVMLEPFKKCIEAGVLSVMPAYNEIDGVPVHASKKYLRDILRGELGFDGMVISDYGAIEMLDNFHQVADGKLEAGKFALEAGVDMEALAIYGYGKELEEAIERKEIDEKLVDESALRVLIFKFKLGIFDNPYAIRENIEKTHSKEAVELSLKMEEESTLLLENDGILPLTEERAGKVAVIGNNAKDTFLGDYTNHTKYCISFYDGILERLGEENVLYARGCNPISGNEEMICEAVETAKKADTVFLVLGDCAGSGGGVPGLDGEPHREITCSEGYDTHDLRFTKWQQKLFDEITKLKKPTVLVLYGGRPFAIAEDVAKVNAFMFSWGGGEQTGIAMARLIFGDVTPSAKLSVSFPQSVGHVPCYYNYKGSARGRCYKRPGSYEKPGRDYILSSPDPWYPFGYGLSYTKLEYSDLKAESLGDCKVKVSVTVENKGDYEINESVLLFVSAVRCPVTPFVKRLRNFRKVNLKPGDRKTVEFMLDSEAFSYVDFDYKTAVCHGKHRIMIDKLECEVDV